MNYFEKSLRFKSTLENSIIFGYFKQTILSSLDGENRENL